MAAATATFSDRRPARTGMTSRASAAAKTSSGTPAEFAPDHDDVGRPEGKIGVGDVAPGRQNRQSAAHCRTPALEGAPGDVALDSDVIEIIHAGAAEMALGHGEARGFDQGGLDPHAGAKAQHRACVLGNVGLEQGQTEGSGDGHAAR